MEVSLLLNSSPSNSTDEVLSKPASTASSGSRRRTPWDAGGYALPVLAKSHLPRTISDGRRLSRSARTEHETPRTARHHEPFAREHGHLIRPDKTCASNEATSDVVGRHRTDESRIASARQQMAHYPHLRGHAAYALETISASTYVPATTPSRYSRPAYTLATIDDPHGHDGMLDRQRVIYGRRQDFQASHDPVSAIPSASTTHQSHAGPPLHPEYGRSTHGSFSRQRASTHGARAPLGRDGSFSRQHLSAHSIDVEREEHRRLSRWSAGISEAPEFLHGSPPESSKSSFVGNNTRSSRAPIPGSNNVRWEKRNLGKQEDPLIQDRMNDMKQPNIRSSPSHLRVQSGGMSSMPEIDINQMIPSHSGHIEGLAYNPTSDDQPFIMPVPRCLYIADCSTGVKFRKTCSHLFGRNKLCTKQIPEQLWVHYCRKHYQRARYRNNRGWPFIQCHLAKEMLNRLGAWSRHNIHHGLPGRVLDWTVKLRKRSQSGKSRSKKRKSSAVERSPDDKIVVLDEVENESGEEDDTTGVVPEWLPQLVGSGYNHEQIIEILDRIQHDLESNTYSQIPDVEFLPNIDEDSTRRHAGAPRHGSLKHQRSQSLGGLPTNKRTFAENRPSTSDRAVDYAAAMASQEGTRYPKRKRFGEGSMVEEVVMGPTSPRRESGTMRLRSRRHLSDLGAVSLSQARETS